VAWPCPGSVAPRPVVTRNTNCTGTMSERPPESGRWRLRAFAGIDPTTGHNERYMSRTLSLLPCLLRTLKVPMPVWPKLLTNEDRPPNRHAAVPDVESHHHGRR
jgi:hypothetical protein